jgi:hypothetical protein
VTRRNPLAGTVHRETSLASMQTGPLCPRRLTGPSPQLLVPLHSRRRETSLSLILYRRHRFPYCHNNCRNKQQQQPPLLTRAKSVKHYPAIVPARHVLQPLAPPRTCSHSQQARVETAVSESDPGLRRSRRPLTPAMTWPTKLQRLPGGSTPTMHRMDQQTQARLCFASGIEWFLG